MDDVEHARRHPDVGAESASMAAVHGVSSDGLATTVLPVAIAGAIFQVKR